MRIGIIGKFGRDSWCLGLAQAFENIGHSVRTDEFTTTPESKVMLAGSSDLLIMIKGNNQNHDLMRQLVATCPGTTLFYTGDSITCGPGNGSRVESIGSKALLFDHIALTGKEGCEWVQEVAPAKPIAQIYQGVRHEIYRPTPAESHHLSNPAICFLGHYYQGDGGRLDKLNHLNREFAVMQSHSIYLEQAADRYYRYAISVNFVCGELTSSRVLRTMASGGFVLTEQNTDIARSFLDGHELVTFPRDDKKEMMRLAHFYMKNKTLRRQIALKGLEKSKQYTWEIQAQKMLDFVFKKQRIVDGAAKIP